MRAIIPDLTIALGAILLLTFGGSAFAKGRGALVGVPAIEERTYQSNLCSRDIPFVNKDGGWASLLGYRFWAGGVASPDIYDEPGLVGRVVEPHPINNSADNARHDEVGFLSNSFEFVFVYCDLYGLQNHIAGKYRVAKWKGSPFFLSLDNILQPLPKIKGFINSDCRSDNLRVDPDVERRGVSDICQGEVQGKVRPINIVGNWAADRDVSLDPRPIRGNQSPLGNSCGVLGSLGRSNCSTVGAYQKTDLEGRYEDEKGSKDGKPECIGSDFFIGLLVRKGFGTPVRTFTSTLLLCGLFLICVAIGVRWFGLK
jgi:hypothetical protein